MSKFLKIGVALAVAVVGLATPPPVAHADKDQEQGLCDVMDDPTGQALGFTPLQYAVMLERMAYENSNMSTSDALKVISDAVHQQCPRHIPDLPPSWR